MTNEEREEIKISIDSRTLLAYAQLIAAILLCVAGALVISHHIYNMAVLDFGLAAFNLYGLRQNVKGIAVLKAVYNR